MLYHFTGARRNILINGDGGTVESARVKVRDAVGGAPANTRQAYFGVFYKHIFISGNTMRRIHISIKVFFSRGYIIRISSALNG